MKVTIDFDFDTSAYYDMSQDVISDSIFMELEDNNLLHIWEGVKKYLDKFFESGEYRKIYDKHFERSKEQLSETLSNILHHALTTTNDTPYQSGEIAQGILNVLGAIEYEVYHIINKQFSRILEVDHV